MKAYGMKELILADFSGISIDINQNYYDSNMQHLMNQEQKERRKYYYKGLILKTMQVGVSVSFLTPSLHE